THLGIFDDYGSIKPGKRADITVLSPSGEVLMTLVAGRPLYTAL
ncbi:MAG: amidohydrolase family protein, partial [Clostridia bacterium]|nr:amidohydrolase family protein [Clostridia bacterium]